MRGLDHRCISAFEVNGRVPEDGPPSLSAYPKPQAPRATRRKPSPTLGHLASPTALLGAETPRKTWPRWREWNPFSPAPLLSE